MKSGVDRDLADKLEEEDVPEVHFACIIDLYLPRSG